MAIDEYVKTFLKDELEFSGALPPGVPGTYTIPFEEGLAIVVAELPRGGFALSSFFAPVPKTNLEAFYTHALLGDLLGQGTHGAVVGLNDEATVLTLMREIDYNVTYKDFRDILEDFINSVDFWRAEALNHR